ncbi:MAG: ATP-binding protein [Vicinamibacterales bacterium]
MPWLTRLRVAAAAVDAGLVVVILTLPDADIPLRTVLPLLALSALVNTGLAYRLSRAKAAPRAASTIALLLDVVLLTGLLDLTGGPFNPFAVVYAAHVALAFVSLGRGPGWAVGVTALGSYATLLYWHTIEGVVVHHRINDFVTHLYTMWVAATITAELVAYFAVQATNAIEELRARATRSERLVSLTTLAAGAAHELSTPLGTIALAARELERAASQAQADAAIVEDARLIRTEVDRCRHILDQMSGRAGGISADAPEPLDIKPIVEDVCAQLPAERRARVQVYAEPPLPTVFASRAGLRQVLSSLVVNALDASEPEGPVLVTAMGLDASGLLRIVVRDRGPGMPADVRARAGEPFFTTKEPGKGLGMGLFLARIFAERSGGTLTIESDAGTVVMLDLPLHARGGPA